MSIAMNTASGASKASARLLAPSRWRAWEVVAWLLLGASPFVVTQHAALINEVAIFALFALSLDLILGYAGIVSLGHAAFFGIGAYTAGLFSKFVWGEPFSGLLAGAAMAAVVGYASSIIIARFRHLTLIMITLGLGVLLHEAAN
ncbi:MAG TPA: branched-chain amino acid ABC transporter permease, partial [Burkholderiaceae bacterium]|nr:branched-chain amino acid ABC transporter permease [Burkholderiaceae bacterium]